MNDNDGEWIDRMQKRIDTYRIYVYYTYLDFY